MGGDGEVVGAGVIHVRSLKPAVLKGHSHISDAFGCVDEAQVELVFLLKAVFPVVGNIPFRRGSAVPLHRIITVPGAVAAASVPVSFVLKIVGQVNRQVTEGFCPPDPKVHVVGKPNVEMLVEEPAAGDAVGSRSERNADDARL